MKVYVILIFTSLWLIHIRSINAQHSNHGTPYRVPLHHHHKNEPFRRQIRPQHQAHLYKHAKTNNKPIEHTSNQQLPVAGFKKKWYPAQPPLQQRRPPQPPPNYMKQRLGQSQFPQLPQQLPLSMPLPVPQKIQSHQHQQIKFQSSPKIIQSDSDFHLNKNQIPQAPIAQVPVAIKQLSDDEKGPIHTIPAPNLSAADKPKHLKLQLLGVPNLHHQHHSTKIENPMKISYHQYQVTEVAEPISNVHHTQEHIQDTIPPLFQYSEVPELSSSHFPGTVKEQSVALLPVQDNYAYSVLHQPQQPAQIPPFFLKQHLNQKLTPTPPEMHTFNYVEPHSTKASAEYALEPEAAIVDQEEGQSQRDEEMMIYVPDDTETLDLEKELDKYEDSNKENNDKRVKDSKRFRYGSRLKPKKI